MHNRDKLAQATESGYFIFNSLPVGPILYDKLGRHCQDLRALTYDDDETDE